MSRRWKAAVLITVAATALAVLAARPSHSSRAHTVGTGRPRLVDVGANKCVPCRAMMPILDELRREQAGVVDVEFLDAWASPDAAESYGVRVLPTQIFLAVDGRELWRHEGFLAKDAILAKWRELGIAPR